jgi:adenylate cyclase
MWGALAMIYGEYTKPIVNKENVLIHRCALERELQKQKDFPDCYLQVSRAYVTEGSLKKALEILQQAFEKNPDYFEARLLHARILLELGLVDKAYHECRMLRAKYDRYADVAFLMGLIFYFQTDLPSALTEARQASELNQKYREAHLLELVIYEKTGRIAEFMQKRKMIAAIDPDEAEKKCFYSALRYFEQSQYASSLFYFSAAQALGYDKWVCLYNGACAYAQMRSFSDAHDSLKTLLAYTADYTQNIIADEDLDPYRTTEYFAALNLSR